MREFLWTIYSQPLENIIDFIVLLVGVWSVVDFLAYKLRLWKLFNAVIFLCIFAAIVFMTMYSRGVQTREIVLIPFWSFVEAKKQPEIYRSMLMNVFLFVPIGLSLPNILPRSLKPADKVCATILFGRVLSAVVEGCQFRYGLGRCEVDDLIVNTLGVAIGALSYAIASMLVMILRKLIRTVKKMLRRSGREN